MAHLLWTELRGPCIRAVWTARCNAIYNPDRPPSTLIQNELTRMLTDLRYVAILKSPPSGLGLPPAKRRPEAKLWAPIRSLLYTPLVAP